MSVDQLQAQGHCELIDLTITNKLGRTATLFGIHGEVSIQEDLFSPTCSGTVAIMDSVNLHEDLPIIGEETLTISYRDGKSSEIVTRKFSIFAIVDKIKLTDKSYGYTLVFVSPEFISNINTKISRAFTNMTPSRIVQSIMQNDIKTKKPITVESTAASVSYISPNISPFAISYAMVPRSYSVINPVGSSYMFFENMRGFNFLPLETLFNRTPVSFILANSNYEPEVNDKIILRYKYINAADTVSNTRGGGLGTKVVVIDDDHRTLSDASYDNDNPDHYARTNHVNGNSPNLRLNKRDKKLNSEEVGMANQSYVLSSNVVKDNGKATRMAKLSSFVNGPRVHIEVPFISTVTVGDMLRIDIPTQVSGQGMNDIMSDTYLSGVYLITALRQIINSDTGVTCMELTRDTYSANHEDNIDAYNRRLGITL